MKLKIIKPLLYVCLPYFLYYLYAGLTNNYLGVASYVMYSFWPVFIISCAYYNMHTLRDVGQANKNWFSKNKLVSIGGFVGFLIWAGDYSFFLNPGGPTTQISDFINNLFGLKENVFPGSFLYHTLDIDLKLIQFLFPLVILILAGGAITYAIERGYKKINNSPK